jgi:hypothetical protein
MSIPPAFTAIQGSFVNDFIAQEISLKQNKYRKISKEKSNKLCNITMLRVAIPPLAIWAVLYCLVEFLI